jgi:hypothetical protein
MLSLLLRAMRGLTRSGWPPCASPAAVRPLVFFRGCRLPRGSPRPHKARADRSTICSRPAALQGERPGRGGCRLPASHRLRPPRPRLSRSSWCRPSAVRRGFSKEPWISTISRLLVGGQPLTAPPARAAMNRRWSKAKAPRTGIRTSMV